MELPAPSARRLEASTFVNLDAGDLDRDSFQAHTLRSNKDAYSRRPWGDSWRGVRPDL